MAFAKSRRTFTAATRSSVTFEDVAGHDEVVIERKKIVEFLQTPGKYCSPGGRVPKGVLLIGAPGTGKTLLARAVAGAAGVPFFSLSGSDFVELFVGVGASRVRNLDEARARARIILRDHRETLDEIAARLIAQETVDAAELKAILENAECRTEDAQRGVGEPGSVS